MNGKVLDIGCGSGVLASFVAPEKYVGFDRDEGSIESARQSHPKHRFMKEFPDGESFDTIVALALIEHLPNPKEELARWASALVQGGKIVVTTPHKAFRTVHDIGAKIGIFSADAADEHEEMFDRSSLVALAESVGLKVAVYERFLFGANQLCVISK
ncbi:trans-aconitate methyltransferase [Rhizobium sp. BK060]|nr:trans-aconitate methyltransferase [Rhizobium sp. BK060]